MMIYKFPDPSTGFDPSAELFQWSEVEILRRRIYLDMRYNVLFKYTEVHNGNAYAVKWISYEQHAFNS